MTDSVSPFDKQIANRNYMSPLGFKLILTKTPKVDFLCQSANIPQISMGTAVQPTYLKDIPVPGDKVLYDDLNVRFLVDEKMENYVSDPSNTVEEAALDGWVRGGMTTREMTVDEAVQKYNRPNGTF